MILIIIVIIIINVVMVLVDKVLPVTCLHTRPVCGTAGTGLKKQNHFLFCFRFIFVKCTNYFLPLLLTLNLGAHLAHICTRFPCYLGQSMQRPNEQQQRLSSWAINYRVWYPARKMKIC